MFLSSLSTETAEILRRPRCDAATRVGVDPHSSRLLQLHHDRSSVVSHRPLQRVQNTASPLSMGTGAGTSLKVGGTSTAQKWAGGRVGHRSGTKHWEKNLVVPSTFLALEVHLVVLVSAFVMVSTVWSVSCLLFFSGCPPVPNHL